MKTVNEISFMVIGVCLALLTVVITASLSSIAIYLAVDLLSGGACR